MVYAAQQQSKNQINNLDLPASIDPSLLKVAKQIYRTYCELNPNLVKRITGVVVNQSTYRGMPLFSHNPILLPQEHFVTLSQLETRP